MAKLIIIRGPSAAGKSTVARLLHTQATRKTALMEQDYFRHRMFNNPHSDIEAPRQVMVASIIAALANDYDVILEGILSIAQYQPYFDQILAVHPTDNYFFYFDVSFEEVLRRHATRAKSQQFGEQQMRDWFARASAAGHASEQRIPQDLSAEQAVACIAGRGHRITSQRVAR